jgi:hypothetical protein
LVELFMLPVITGVDPAWIMTTAAATCTTLHTAAVAAAVTYDSMIKKAVVTAAAAAAAYRAICHPLQQFRLPQRHSSWFPSATRITDRLAKLLWLLLL